MPRPILFAVIAALPAAAFAQGTAVRPGKWEVVTTIGSLDMPGAPPAIAGMMKGRPIRISHCLTPEEAARGPQEMMKSNKQCQFTKYSMAGGRLSSEMVCKQGGSTTTAVSSGSFSATGFTTTGRTVTTGAQAMTMTATSVGRRIGDCR